MSLWRRIFGLAPKVDAEERFVSPPDTNYDGSTFWRGVTGQIDEIANLDYWTLRQRSAALFYSNSYGRGIVRRMVTDIINTGLSPEATPDEEVLSLPEDSLVDWSEIVEKRYRLYGESTSIIDAKARREDGQLQAQIHLEALVEGDCLVINRQDETGLPQIQIVNGSRVQTPPGLFTEPYLVDGVKVDKDGRHLGYWVYQGTADIVDDRYVYVPARGSSTGRRTAWLVYGPDKREDGIRGEPLLGIAIQPLNEVLVYRGSAQLKAKINSMIVGFIKRPEGVRPKSMPIGSAALRKTTVTGDAETVPNPVSLSEIMPGVFMERLEPGEEPVPHSTHGTDVNFGAFEAAVMVGLAWALQIPPEILLMSFNKNYSASQAANNKWKTYITKERARFAGEHCKLLYEEWLISEALLGKISAPGFIEALNNPARYDIRQAWLQSEWYGQIEPSVDVIKQTNGYKTMIAEGWTTNTRAAREINGSKFTQNVRRLQKENELKAAAMRPLLELQQEFGEQQVAALLHNNPEILAAHLLAAAQEDRETET